MKKRNRSASFLGSIGGRRFVVALVFLFHIGVFAQPKIAIVAPNDAESSQIIERFRELLGKKNEIIDPDLIEAARKAAPYENFFNLNVADARNFSVAVGCDYIVVLKAGSLKRFSVAKQDYFETFLFVFLVSGRNGQLIFSKVEKAEAADAANVENNLLHLLPGLAEEILELETRESKLEQSAKTDPPIPFAPDSDSPEAKNFRPPLPYKRIKPDYTKLADLYSVEATVDVLVDVGTNGEILRTEISRWAGFGLDESVVETVRKMKWRPASREGKSLPIRILLRYNFRKLEKDKK